MLKTTILTILLLLTAIFAQSRALDRLPPDPGEAGKMTILGIDSEGHGVRDDILIQVTRLIPDDPYARAGALFWFAMQQEKFKVYLQNPNESFEFFYPYFLASMASARYSRRTGATDLISVERRLVMLLNTRERFLINSNIDGIAHGRVITHFSHYPDFVKKFDEKFQEFYEREKERQR